MYLLLTAPVGSLGGKLRMFGSPPSSQKESGKHRLSCDWKKSWTSLVLPVQVTHAGDGSGRIFVVGAARSHPHRSRMESENDVPFLDISEASNGCCEELEAFSTSPFPQLLLQASQQFYVSYYQSRPTTLVISRFSSHSRPRHAVDPDSEEILLTIKQPHHVHNVGRLLFGPQDGYLYVGIGDGGSDGYPVHYWSGPPTAAGQRSCGSTWNQQTVPYLVSPPAIRLSRPKAIRDEIWALGLRNPWGFAFDGTDW